MMFDVLRKVRAMQCCIILIWDIYTKRLQQSCVDVYVTHVSGLICDLFRVHID